MLSLINSTVEKNWPILVLILVIYATFRILQITKSRKKIKIFKEVYNVIAIVYVFLLASIMSFGELNVTSGINLVPFKEIFRYELFSDLFMLNIVGNILLFAPLGYFIGYYIKTKSVMLVALIATMISFIGELLQRYVGRTFDIDDIILNLSGAVLGFLIYKILYGFYRKLPNVFQKDGLYNIICIIIIFILILYILEVVGVVNLIWIVMK